MPCSLIVLTDTRHRILTTTSCHPKSVAVHMPSLSLSVLLRSADPARLAEYGTWGLASWDPYADTVKDKERKW